jgi:hypothetical protein
MPFMYCAWALSILIVLFQVVLAKSPTLKTALKTEVRYQSEAMMIFPEFKKRSLVMMLQFLYTGEVGK